MIYVLKCKCESVEWDGKRKCKHCGKKFRQKYNLTDEYSLVEYGYLENKNGEHYFNPQKSRKDVNLDKRPLYVLQCKCGCCEFDEKRRCMNCSSKFKNNVFRNKYMVVRYDWLNEDSDKKLSYTYDTSEKKPIITDHAPSSLLNK